ncbi:MAG: LytTR family DNA-binding domain-containing protein [Bacteroidia bacterium]|nr:LytTR family DNA-binding domain-containing protein [Bacteroidia bacterium]
MIKALIIDDEEDARESLRLSLEKFCKEVEILSLCDGPHEGLAKLSELKPDLVFLDIQMPSMSGFDLLEQVGEPDFQVIFVTAHDKYAIKAIRFSALDYLLKPVDIEELVKAVQRAIQKMEGKHTSAYKNLFHNLKNRMGTKGRLAVPTLEGMAFINVSEIIFCEAEGSYTTVYLSQATPMLVSRSLKDFEQMLDPSNYCRVHHSSLINLNHVKKYIKGDGGYVIMDNGSKVDISRRRKEEFMRLISKI